MFSYLLCILLLSCSCSSSADNEKAAESFQLSVSPSTINLKAEGETIKVKVTANSRWDVRADQSWCKLEPTNGFPGETLLAITALKNNTDQVRQAILAFTSGEGNVKKEVLQEKGTIENYVPKDYQLVWQDEFNASRESNGKPATPSTQSWWFETGGHGWGNNEIQDYVNVMDGTDTCAIVSDGTLKIIAQKKGNRVLSIRMNTQESWTYGYFEARLKLPTGKGTWPAFWMLPKDFKNWPADGEIDIMEEVGYRPNWVSSAIHCQSFNHAIQTEKTGEQFIETAQSDFHIYALEWTKDYIHCYVDGKRHFTFENDRKGDKATWPFNVPFYLKLNLAWGGNWGGAQGIDEQALPAVYEIDYVRVYQKTIK